VAKVPLTASGIYRVRLVGAESGFENKFSPEYELRAEADLVVGDNEPYAVSDETDYTIPVHGEARGLMNTGIEIRQDLIANPAGQQQWADRLARIFGEIETMLRAQRLLPT
jgi:predicted N-formylglutamate amidohydrolase